MSSTRRVFIHRMTFLGGGVVLLGGACSRSNGGDRSSDNKSADPRLTQPRTSKHLTFTNAEYVVLSAAVDRLIPRDEDPGALDANVPFYIDKMLTTPELLPMHDDMVAGLNALDRRSRGQWEKGFSELTPAQQDALLTEFKTRIRSPAKRGFWSS